VYEGQWAGNKMDGHGIYTSPDGTRLEGQWKNGEFIK
jgi:hypothetical protein